MNGLITVTNLYVGILSDTNITDPSASERLKYDVWRYMDRLELEPPFRTEIGIINGLTKEENAPSR